MDTDIFSTFDVDRREMSLSEVHTCRLGAFRFLIFFNLVLSAKLILISIPSDLDSLLYIYRTIRTHPDSIYSFGAGRTVLLKLYRAGWNGWAIQTMVNRWLSNVADFDAVEIETANGGPIRLGTGKPERLAEVLASRGMKAAP